MKILLLTTKVPFPARDGGSLAIVSWVKSLLDLQHQVTILAANTPKHKVEVKSTDTEPDLDIISIPVDTNIRWKSLILNLLFSKKPYQVTRFGNKAYAHKLRELLHSNQYQVVQLEGAPLGIYMKDCRLYPETRVILRAHNVESALWQEIMLNYRSWIKKMYLKIQVRRYQNFETNLLNLVDGVIAISDTDRDLISKMARPHKIQTISYGLDLNPLGDFTFHQDNTLYFIGALDWRPNQEGLCWFVKEVWPRLYPQNPNLTFHVGGRNAPAWFISFLSVPGIVFHGEVRDAIEFSRKHTLMVVPLFSGSGIRIKILEAMALGKVIVSTSKGAAGLAVNHGSEIFLADEAGDFAASILQLLDDPHRINSIGKMARDFVARNYEISGIKKKMDIWYKEINLR